MLEAKHLAPWRTLRLDFRCSAIRRFVGSRSQLRRRLVSPFRASSLDVSLSWLCLASSFHGCPWPLHFMAVPLVSSFHGSYFGVSLSWCFPLCLIFTISPECLALTAPPSMSPDHGSLGISLTCRFPWRRSFMAPPRESPFHGSSFDVSFS